MPNVETIRFSFRFLLEFSKDLCFFRLFVKRVGHCVNSCYLFVVLILNEVFACLVTDLVDNRKAAADSYVVYLCGVWGCAGKVPPSPQHM